MIDGLMIIGDHWVMDGLMMIGDDQVETKLHSQVSFSKRRDTAIDRNDQLAAILVRLADCGRRQPVAILHPQRDMVVDNPA